MTNKLLLKCEAFAGADSRGGAACCTGASGILVDQRRRVGPTGPRKARTEERLGRDRDCRKAQTADYASAFVL